MIRALIGLVVLLIIAGIGYVLFTNNSQKKIVEQQKQTTTPLPTQITTPTNPDSIHFTSQKLAISFDYAKETAMTPPYPIKTIEEGSKVYVYVDNGTNPHTGQWVEVFQKEKTQTVADAIKQKFLANYAAKDCSVSMQTTYPDKAKLPTNYEIAEITFPQPTDANEPWFANADKCPATYTTTNGISYFLMDKNHPDKYVYFSIGQYGIPAGTRNEKELWQDTFRFTD